MDYEQGVHTNKFMDEDRNSGRLFLLALQIVFKMNKDVHFNLFNREDEK